MKKWIWIVAAILVLGLGVRSCGTQKQSAGSKEKTINKTTLDHLPVLAQNQVPENPHVVSTHDFPSLKAPPDPKDSFGEVPEERSLKDTPYGKHQM